MTKKITAQVRKRVALVSGLVMALMLVGGPAFATTSSTDPVKTAVTPYFNDLKGLATDMIPLALAVIAIGIGFKLALGWFRRSRA